MSDVADVGVSVDTGTTTAVDVPELVTDKSSERFSATPPPSPTLSPALQPGPTSASLSPANDPAPAETPAVPELAVEPMQPEETPVIETPKEMPQPPAAAAAPVVLSIKDRAYAALEKIRFSKRRKLDKIVALAKEKGRIKNDDVEKLLRVSDSTAARYLKQLVLEARLFVTKKENDAWYETY